MPTPDVSKMSKSNRRSAASATEDYVGVVVDSVNQGFDRVNTSIDRLSQKIEENSDRLTAAQEKTELALVQLASQVKSTNKSLEGLSDDIKEMRSTIAEHLKLAQQQTKLHENQALVVAELTRLCTILTSKAG